jgi:hypothetical protein
MLPITEVFFDHEDCEYVGNYHTKFVNPYGPNHWPTIMLDQSALVNIIRKFEIKSFLEIGTWEGYTTLCMWLCPTIIKAKSIDMCQEYYHGGSEYHNPEHLKRYARYFKDITPVEFQEVDSTKYGAVGDSWDMVFIDGNHNYDYVNRDWELAQRIATRIVAFHDYDNGNPGVDRLLEEIVKDRKLFNYKGTAVVYVEV